MKEKNLDKEKKKRISAEDVHKSGHHGEQLDKLKDIESELDKKKKEASEYFDTLLRLKAEFENYKKRMMKEQTSFIDYANEGLMLKLLTVIDNFERALCISEETKEHHNIFKGIEMIYGELLGVLEKEGLKEVAAGGEFDPSLHEAVMQIEEEGYKPNHIVDVLRKGYFFKDKLLRPAMVKVQKSDEGQ